jgi:putative ABC transport system permease protein
VIFSWALREIRNTYKFSIFFVLNLSIGLVGFLCLDAFKYSLDLSLKQNAKAGLAADVAVGVRRSLTESEVQIAKDTVGEYSSMGRVLDFFSMVAGKHASRLVQVKVIDSTYPLYGELKVSPSSDNLSQLQKEKIVWVYPELLSQLNLQVGESLKLGEDFFKIAGVVDEDTSETFRFSALAAKIYVGLEQMRGSSLIGTGTTLTDTLLFKLPAQLSSQQTVELLKDKISDPAIRIQDYNDSSSDSARPLKYLSDYLSLVSLVALFLAALGSAYIFRSFIQSRFYQIAIFNALGLQKTQAQWIYLVQLSLLGLLAALVSSGGAWALLPIISKVLREFTPLSIPVVLPLKTVGLSILMGMAGSLLIGFPFLRPATRVQTSQLLSESTSMDVDSRSKDWILFLPGILLYWLLAMLQSNSIKIGSQFIGIFFLSMLSLWLLGYAIIWILGHLPLPRQWTIKHAVLSISRRKGMSIAVVVALGLGSMLMNLLPQLKVGLEQDMEAPKKMKLPNLFLFDIQDDQINPLKEFVLQDGKVLEQISPMVRARILKLNGENFERANLNEKLATREDEEQTRMRNRGVNLSYRDRLTDSESLVEGTEFSGNYDNDKNPVAELSVEVRYADRLGLKLGDRLTFDVQGIEVEGQIVNLRSVKWNSFRPNFFIQFQPGVLDEAPKTYLAALSNLPKAEIENFQNHLVTKFPNVSVIDVGRMVQRIFELTSKMIWSLQLMATLSLLAGLVILFSIVNYQVHRRSWDLNIMKIFGADHKSLLRFLIFEFGLLAFIGALFGVLLSFAISYILAWVLFEGTFSFSLEAPLITLGSVTVLSASIVWLVSRKIVMQKPAELLGQKT